MSERLVDTNRKALYEANPRLIPPDLCVVCYHREESVRDGVCEVCRLRAEIATLRAEVARVREENADILAGRCDIQRLVVENGGFDLRLGNDGARVVAGAIVELFRTGGGENFLTLTVGDPKTNERFDVTIQRALGKTPSQKHAEDIAALTAQLAAERERWLKLLGPCPKRRIHERYKDSTHPELIAAARMCTPENPCERCRALPAPEAT